VLIVGSSSANNRERAASIAKRFTLFSSNHGSDFFVDFNLKTIMMDF
jgi:hypothetical protein